MASGDGRGLLRAQSRRAKGFRDGLDPRISWPAGQFLTRPKRNVPTCTAVALALVVAAGEGCRSRPDQGAEPGITVFRGGEVVVAIRTEPPTFNKLPPPDTNTELASP